MDSGVRNCLPGPNAYNYRIGDVNSDGVLAYGNFSNIIVFKMMWQPTFLGFTEHCHSKTKCVRFNQSKCNVLASADSQEVKIWNLEYDGLHIKNQQVFQHVSSIEWSFSSIDILFVAHSKNIITKWNVEENDKEDMTCGIKTDEITIMASDPLKPLLAVGFKNGFVALFDVESCVFKQTIYGHQKELTNISFSRHSNQILTSSCDGVICVWTIQEEEDDAKGRVCYEWRGRFPELSVPFAVWNPAKVNVVIVTTVSGHVGELDLSIEGEMEVMNYENDMQQDNKTILCLFSSPHLQRAIYTFTKDRMFTLWDLGRQTAIAEIFTYKSPIKCIAFPPISTGISGTLAIASQERNLLFWDTGSDPKVFKAKTCYNAISSPVICLAWHPREKNKIAFGTDDGSVAIIDDWTWKSKSPNYCNLKHDGRVTFLCWGPCLKLTGTSTKTTGKLALFSCGNGTTLIHFMDKSINFFELIQSDGRKYLTSICWKEDLSMFATGNGDGSLDIYDGETFELLVEVVVCATSVYNISWHPNFTLQNDTQIQTSLHSWLAAYFPYIGGGKGEIVVYDVQKDVVNKYEHQKPVQSIFLYTNFINCLAWSPYFEEQLASATTDGVSVWNILSGQLLFKFVGHFSSAQTVTWSAVDKDIIFSGSNCSTLLTFSPSQLTQEQKNQSVFIQRKGTQFHSRQVTNKVPTPFESDDDESVTMEKESVVMETELVTTEKESVIMETESVVTEKEVPDGSEESLKELTVESNLKTSEKSECFASFLSVALDKVIQENTSKYVRLLDTYVTKKQNNCIDTETVQLGEGDLQYLGVFGDKEDILKMVEAQVLNDDVSQSDRITFDLWWKNDLTKQAKQSIANGTISDELFSYVPQVSRSLWREVCLAYAKQLEDEGSYYKAVICLLMCQKIREAIILLKDKNIVDALMLARRYIIDENDILLNEVIESFKQQLLDGELQPSAKG